MPKADADTFPDPRQEPTMDVVRAAKFYGLRSRPAAYRAAAAGDIPTIRVGGKLRVPTAAVAKQLGFGR